MKKYMVFLLVGLILLPVPAQGKSLLAGGFKDMDHGFFGGPVIKFTQVHDDFGVMLGGRGGWIVNHKFVIGGGGYGLANEIKADEVKIYDFVPGVTPELSMVYGGLELEFILKPTALVHASFYTLIGAGEVSYKDWDWSDGSDEFFVVEPALNVIVNVTDFFRINSGAGYRFVIGAELDNIDNKELSGISGTLMFNFGKF